MTVTSTSLALGSWSIKLKPGTPQDVIDQLTYLGHIAISVGRPDPRVSGDSLLTSARYVGPLRKITYQGEGVNLSGAGMNYWLGDENKKGPVITDQLLYTAADFTSVVTQLLAQGQSVRAGTIHSVTGGYTGYHQYVTIREALTFVCSTMTSDTLDPVEFRVNGDGTCDAGTASQLYVYGTPKTAIIRKRVGADMTVRALPGKASVDEDVQDYATRVILLGQGSGLGIASAEVHLDPAVVPYKDLFGNKVVIARTVSQSSTDAANSLQQAQIALNQYAKPRDAVTLSTDQFDITGDLQVGDSVWVHDPDAGLIDTSPTPNEFVFRGERLNPVRLRVSEMTWPVETGMSVAYRNPDGVWIDLTDYVVFETGTTSVTVGGYDRSLTNPTGRQEALGSRAAPNTSIPAVPAFQLPFVQAVYQSVNSGVTKAQVQVRWQRPLNTDGSAIIDGDHYEIRYRTSDNPGYPSTWAQAAGKTWNQLGTWSQPISYVPGPWTTAYAPFDSQQLLIQELTPGVPYDIQIRAVDNGIPPNYSSWSSSTTVTTNGDTIPPPQPAPPEVAASTISVQVTHLLGAASGGTFNLPADLHHLEVHGQYEPTYECTPATLLGKLPATNGMILSQTPVVGTLAIQSTAGVYIKVVAVDEAGNRSTASTPVQSTALLVDDEHISNLTVSKLLAGTVTSDWILGANIQTAASGVGAGMNALGLFARNALDSVSWKVDAATGDMVTYTPSGTPTMRCQASTGNIYLYAADGTTPVLTLTASSGLINMVGKLTSGSGVGAGSTVVVDPATAEIDMYPDSTTARYRLRAATQSLTGGGTGPTFDINALTTAGVKNGPFMHMQSDLAWIGHLDGTGTGFGNTTGAIVKLERAGQAILGTDNGSVRVQSTGEVNLITPGGSLNVNAAGTATTSLPFGGTTNGFSFDAQAGSSGGYRMVSDGTYLRFVQNSGNVYLIDPTGPGGLKCFVTDHPADPQRWLVHGCTESPQSGVEYWGEATIVDHEAVVELPGYFEGIARPEGRQVQVTIVAPDEPSALDEVVADAPLHGPETAGHVLPPSAPGRPAIPEHALLSRCAASTPKDGRFRIVSDAPDGTRVAWLVKATRADVPLLEAEPLRASVDVHGDGPYRYLTPKEAA